MAVQNSVTLPLRNPGFMCPGIASIPADVTLRKLGLRAIYQRPVPSRPTLRILTSTTTMRRCVLQCDKHKLLKRRRQTDQVGQVANRDCAHPHYSSLLFYADEFDDSSSDSRGLSTSMSRLNVYDGSRSLWGYTGRTFASWLVTWIVGITIGFVAFTLHASVKWLTLWRNQLVLHIHDGFHVGGLIVFVVWNAALVRSTTL